MIIITIFTYKLITSSLHNLLINRFSNAWVLLGHVLASQEESEHAISAYRTACRVLPGNHEPQVFMAKELVII